jgi:predicted HTH domain antitoxin
MTYHLSIEYGDDVLLSAAMSKEEFDAEARFLLAGKLYELGRLTSGQAGRLCGKGRVDFLLALPRIGVSPVNLGAEDAEAEADLLRRG